MSLEIPLGKREDLHLEFKSVEALERPEIIGREVAAMLNAEGGEVWIGLREQDGVAVEIQAVPNPCRASEALHDSLVDRLEPSPLPTEVRVEPVSFADERSVLRVIVKPVEERKPYAFLKSRGRHYQVRIGNRIRDMPREEIRELFIKSPDRSGSITDAVERVLSERGEFQETSFEKMWLRILPTIDMGLDLQSLPLLELLEDPSRTGNRRIGSRFVRTSVEPELAKQRLVWRYKHLFDAELSSDGGLEFILSLHGLHWKGDENEIWPEALLEYPASAFRLARTIYESWKPKACDIVSDLALFGIRGWKLRPGSPSDEFFRIGEPAIGYPGDEDDLLWPKPLVYKYEEVLDEPDHCGYRLVRRVYEAFGIWEEDMPKEFDPKTGRLVLKDF